MQRTFATTTLALAVIALSACDGGAGDAVKLVPDGATVIGGVDLAAATKSKAYEAFKKQIEEGEGKETMDAAKACNLGPDKWKSITFGAAPPEEKMVIVFKVDGIGKKENLDCAHEKIKEAEGGKDSWTSEEKDGKLVLTFTKKGGKGYVTDDNTLVMTSKDWDGAVSELIGGKGKTAVDGSLKEIYGRAEKGKNVWVAGKIPADMLKGSPGEGATDATMWMDLSKGLELAAAVSFGSAEDATGKAEQLNKMFDENKGMATTFGVPQTVVDSVKIEAKDKAVSVQATISEEDVTKLSDAAEKAMPGGAK